MTEEKTGAKEKVYKKIKCYKCGNTYDDIYRRCPACNASNTLHYLGIFAISLVITYLVIAVTFTMIKTINLEKSVKSLQFSSSANSGYIDTNTETLDITQRSYYDSINATDENFENMIDGVDTYILYFHQNSCQYCEQANVFIDAYIQLGYANVVPVISVTPNDANATFTKFQIESTPTAIFVNNGEQTVYNGVDKVYELFDSLVEHTEE